MITFYPLKVYILISNVYIPISNVMLKDLKNILLMHHGLSSFLSNWFSNGDV